MKGVKPVRATKKLYFKLSKAFEREGLKANEYRQLLWYWERYKKIENFGKYNKDDIKEIL